MNMWFWATQRHHANVVLGISEAAHNVSNIIFGASESPRRLRELHRSLRNLGKLQGARESPAQRSTR